MGRVKILRASAGSGKTYRLAYEYVRAVVAEPASYRNILAVTFTNKATDEMKRRILTELNDLAYGRPTSFMRDLVVETGMMPEAIRSRAKDARGYILHDYSHFAISTIDAFFQRIIRAFLKELSLDSDFVLELQTDSILSVAIDYMLDDSTRDERLKSRIERYVNERIDDSKRWVVKEELLTVGRELFKEIFTAATGQSDFDNRDRIEAAYNNITAGAERLKTEMQRVAAEAVDILNREGLTVDDFPYKKAGFINYFYSINQRVFDGYGSRVAAAVADPDKWYSKSSARKADIIAAAGVLQPMLERLTRTWDEGSRYIRTAELIRENFRAFMLMPDIAERIRRVGREQNLVMMHETAEALTRLIEDNDAPFIYEKVGNTYGRFMIDEFQDTSAGQWRRFLPLLQNSVASSEDDAVLVVGDIKQSIYGWRGGDWRILDSGVNREFDRIEAQTLDTNWRSDANIISFNNLLIRSVVAIDNDYLNTLTTNSCEATEYADMLARAYSDSFQKLPKGKACDRGYARVTIYDQTPDITGTVAELIDRGFSQRDIAVLVRKNSEAASAAAELIDAGYNIMSQEALAVESADVVRFMIAVMRIATGDLNPVTAAVFNRYLGRDISAVPDGVQQAFFATLPLCSLDEAVERIIAEFNLGGDTGGIPYLQGFHDIVLRYCGRHIADISLFLRWWDENGGKQKLYLPGEQDAITVMTIHKSKGLQYKAVIIPHCDWSLIPDRRSYVWAASDEEPFAELNPVMLRYKQELGESVYSEAYLHDTLFSHIENINLLYVALTRAEQELHVMMPEKSVSLPSNGGIKNVAHLVGNCVGLIDGVKAVEKIYTYGTPRDAEQPEYDLDAAQELPSDSYPSYDPEQKIRIRWPGERYKEGAIDPRRYGVLMHKVFESIDSETDIASSLAAMVVGGIITDAERLRIKQMIERAMDNPTVREWFSPRWKVRNEHEIIVPGSFGRFRPDRVVTDGGEAVVIDYKFGGNVINSHVRQVDNYTGLLREMGYSDVKGYVWYVEINKVVEV